MFTGIIEAIGTIEKIENRAGDVGLTVLVKSSFMEDVNIGDSISTDGVCLTVTSLENNSYTADVSNETLQVSCLSKIKLGDKVNLEKALRLQDRLGGHIVSGHIDCKAEVINIKSESRSWQYKLKIPEKFAKYISVKGSICINGISLTINNIENNNFYVNIVPHTKEETNIKYLKVGSEVNIEIDLLARYLERLLMFLNTGSKQTKITKELLQNSGILQK